MGLTARSLSSTLRPLEAKLASHAKLAPEELQLLRGQPAEVRNHPARTEVLDNGQDSVRLITSGWVGITRTLGDGRRQILQVALAGDLVKAPTGGASGVAALTPASSVDARPLMRHLEQQPPRSPLAAAWRLAELEQQRRLLDQIVRLGSLTAYERAANLIVELMRRHERAGLADGRRMPWPVTQEVVSDILGLSIVHVNRVLQQLRRDGLIEIRAGSLLVCDMPRLANLGCAASEPAALYG